MKKIIEVVNNQGGNAVKTAAHHQTGTDRVFEVFKEILKSKYYKRLVFDELFAHFLLSSKIRTKIKKINKSQKIFKDCKEKLIQDLNFK